MRTGYQIGKMFSAQNAVFKELLREQRKCYDGALSAVMNEILIALGESEVSPCSGFSKKMKGKSRKKVEKIERKEEFVLSIFNLEYLQVGGAGVRLDSLEGRVEQMEGRSDNGIGTTKLPNLELPNVPIPSFVSIAHNIVIPPMTKKIMKFIFLKSELEYLII